MAGARQIADNPMGYVKKLFTPDSGDAFQKEADKRAGVNSKEMTAAPLMPNPRPNAMPRSWPASTNSGRPRIASER